MWCSATESLPKRMSIVIGHCSGNPYGGYSGGYKMIVTGLSGWRSIASHHSPPTMHRKDWLGASTSSYQRKQFKSIGRAWKGNGQEVFCGGRRGRAVLAVLDVKAGSLELIEDATWPLADKRTNIALDMKNRRTSW